MNIRLATADDRDTLVELYLAMLAELDKYGIELLPTQHNAEHFVDNVFLPAAEEGDPVLIAWRDPLLPDGNNAAGALFWVCNRAGLDTRHKAAHGYGTYVAEWARKGGLGTLLRKVGVEMLREMGYTHVFGGEQIRNEAGQKASRKFGFEPFAVADLLDISKVPPLQLPL